MAELERKDAATLSLAVGVLCGTLATRYGETAGPGGVLAVASNASGFLTYFRYLPLLGFVVVAWLLARALMVVLCSDPSQQHMRSVRFMLFYSSLGVFLILIFQLSALLSAGARYVPPE